MSATGESSLLPRPGGDTPARPADGNGPLGGSLLAALAILAGSALTGAAGGLIWATLAPRAEYVVVAHGSADVINPETSAFIAADLAYCAIGVVAGLIIGLAGYLMAVRRYGPWPMGAIFAGGVLAGIVARLIGQNSGLAAFNHQLLTSPLGSHLQAPLALAGDTSASVWPTAASLPALAFWPLAGCAVAGGFVLAAFLRERSATAQYAAVVPDAQRYGSLPGQ